MLTLEDFVNAIDMHFTDTCEGAELPLSKAVKKCNCPPYEVIQRAGAAAFELYEKENPMV